MSTINVRGSSWGSLFDCAYRWEGNQLLGLRMPSSPRALIGNGLHAGSAAFDQARVDGTPISADDAAEPLIKALREPGFDVDWSDKKFTVRTVEQTALALHVNYCKNVSPQFDFHSVEMQLEPLEIDCGGDTKVVLTGRMDRARVRKVNGSIGISDLKTGIRVVVNGVASTKNHRPQIGTYELLFEHTTGVAVTAPGEIIGLSTSGNNEIATGEVHNARRLMVGDGETPGLIEFAADMFRSGLFPPNPSSILCAKAYCARWNKCPYHE